jgi:hypothetical protein
MAQDKGSAFERAPKQAKKAAEDTLRKEKQGAQQALHDTSEDLSKKASDLASDAKDAALHKAEGAKEGIAGSIDAFAEALNAAGGRLAEDGQSTASRLLSEAGASLENLSGSLRNKSLGEMLEDSRELGRRNMGGLFAGSVLAGLAIGRLWKSAGPAQRSYRRGTSGLDGGPELGTSMPDGKARSTPATGGPL